MKLVSTIGFVFLWLILSLMTADAFEPSKEFRQYCGSCHGPAGNGQGKAARYLYPKPRDLVNGRMRFATSTNLVASADDLKRVIKNGIPGTSMQNWSVLNDDLIDRLVVEIGEMQKLGARLRAENEVREDGNYVDANGTVTKAGESLILRYIEMETVPGSIWKIPEISLSGSDTEQIAAGRAVYLKQNCHKCHAEDGSGSWGLDLVDGRGFPTFARDLRRDPLKAGHEIESMARVIRLGMAGTAMPSSDNLSDIDLLFLVKYVRSLGTEPKLELGNIQRYHRAIGFSPE
ncbi:MAG: c-type cytochrome [Planctomycetota bacterium]|nr:c-type cytochrome [Planctomycetota bacterium]